MPAAAVMAAVAPVLLALAACAPELNWRELRPAGSDAVLLLPCKPDRLTRTVRLAGREVGLTLVSCRAGDATWALAFADVVDPALVAPALAELKAAARENIASGTPRAQALAVPGATPNPESGRFELAGKLPDGRAVHEQLAVFARGTRVYQATVLGSTLPPDALRTFFGNLRIAF